MRRAQALEIGVCNWSIDRRQPAESIRTAVQDYGVRVVHLGFFDEDTLNATSADEVAALAEDLDVAISATFAAFPGEDYQSITTIARTGGYLPNETWPQRLEYTRRVADLSAELDVRRLAIHVATIPEKVNSAAFKRLVDRTGQAADVLAELGLTLLLETGRESAATLANFISAVGRRNVAVNFDPGNLLIYGTGSPVRALRTLGDRIDHVHLKDAVSSDQLGAAWGTEATLGTGEAEIARVVSKLRSSGYSGPLIVERTSGRGDPGTLADSIAYLRSLVA